MQLGSKKQSVTTSDDGIITINVSEKDQYTTCLSNVEVLELAKIAVIQESLWGSPRDIEWAINVVNTFFFLFGFFIIIIDKVLF